MVIHIETEWEVVLNENANPVVSFKNYTTESITDVEWYRDEVHIKTMQQEIEVTLICRIDKTDNTTLYFLRRFFDKND